MTEKGGWGALASLGWKEETSYRHTEAVAAEVTAHRGRQDAPTMPELEVNSERPPTAF